MVILNKKIKIGTKGRPVIRVAANWNLSPEDMERLMRLQKPCAYIDVLFHAIQELRPEDARFILGEIATRTDLVIQHFTVRERSNTSTGESNV